MAAAAPKPRRIPRMTVAEAARELDRVRTHKSKARLFHFFVNSWSVIEKSKPLALNWHIEVAADHIQWVLEGWVKRRADPTYVQEVQNLIENLPPGSAKSRLLSVCAVAWMWIDHPEFSFLCLSSNGRVAERDGRYCRDLIRSPWYQRSFRPKWKIRRDQDGISNFANTAGGTRVAHGMDSSFVGERADGILIDDANDPKDTTESSRLKVNEGWDSGIANRVNDDYSIRIGIQHRVHEDDWTGHVLGKGDMEWALLCLPTEFVAERRCRTAFGFVDPRTREGEVLHAERQSPAWLRAERIRLGPFGYAALHQQQPSPAGGGIFKLEKWGWWRPEGTPAAGSRPFGCVQPERVAARVVPIKNGKLDLDWRLISVDATFGSTTDAASNVGLLLIGGKGPSARFVMDDRTRPMTFLEMLDEIERMATDHGRAAPVDRIIVEKKALGAAIIEVMKRRLTVPIIGWDPVGHGSKQDRAVAMSPAVDAGDWYVLEGAQWAGVYVGELGSFPRGKKNDRVDASSQIAIYAQTNMLTADRWAALNRQ